MFDVGDIVDGHAICLKALVGSHNYNLNTPKSDKDYKYFVWPTFEDLYRNQEYHKEVVTNTEDYTIHDIRKLPSLLWKANLNFIEILYSRELSGNSTLIDYLTENREKLATMNLPRLYAASMGTSIQKEKLMLMDSPARHEAIQTYGYDPKSAHHAIRVVDFLTRYYKTRYFASAFWYEQDSMRRDALLWFKEGEFSLKTVKFHLDNYRNHAKEVESFFVDQKPNPQPLEDLNKFIKAAIHERIINTKRGDA